MANSKINVQRIGPYGVMVGGVWLKYGKGVTNKDFPQPGEYEVDSNTGNKGVVFINKVLEITGPQLDTETNTATLAIPRATGKVATQYGRPVSEYELAKDRRISRAGIVQAVIQSPALASFDMRSEEGKEAFVSTAKAIADELLEWVGQ